ncbi:predicted protein [Coccidioides posadasii str. Silveira]|uniref:Predicted protein n=2 Tax=Coccidioides posadasii TaxID=199306 RepID=E9DDC3_COCPS|nr:predicted protein [Coccidioides posadasii str. Silveira]KMM65662.1 hypothetical protein CPAG_02008 [Coccidioides posadasii RMSCC 3488]
MPASKRRCSDLRDLKSQRLAHPSNLMPIIVATLRMRSSENAVTLLQDSRSKWEVSILPSKLNTYLSSTSLGFSGAGGTKPSECRPSVVIPPSAARRSTKQGEYSGTVADPL